MPIVRVRLAALAFVPALALASPMPAHAASADVTIVTPANMHLEALRPAKMTYLVYMHGAADTGFSRPMLASTEVHRETVDGTDAWVIGQHWEDETGVVHTARTVHAARDVATLSQETTWKRPTATYTMTVVPAEARGSIEGDIPDAAKERAQAGFATMDDGWWFNWHSDLTLLPLLPYEKGGTLRVHLFDVGMDAPKDIDYVVAGERTLRGADGSARDCWLVQTDSGHPGTGNFQRFWIDKARRVVVEEEDVYNGQYRSKILLAAPVVVEFALPPKQS